ncbi:hypothetical protein GGI23_000293 [Coemansia sp. RSA 2559]|nr:hypothetical protein GGI23_000293 [Coemansia sp. RSA 2559]KAJ2869416.1 hypothetical protein GGI22_000269 [Coemansia erecta]
MDPPPWSDPSMKLILPNVHSFQLPDPSWQWVSPRWLIDMTLDVDDDGWQYSSRFGQAVWHGRHSATRSFVRRRRWLRLRRRLRATAPHLSDPANANEATAAANNNVIVGLQPSANESKVRRKKTMLLASKFKNKVSSGYVGACPKSPTKPEANALAYTLKDGRYRSHNLKAVDSYAMEVAARVLSCPASPVDYSEPSSPTQQHQQQQQQQHNAARGKSSLLLARPPSSALLKSPKLSDGNIPGTRMPYSRISDIGAIAEEKEEAASDGDSEEEESSGLLAARPTVPSFNIVGSSPSSQTNDEDDDQEQQQQQQQRPDNTLQQLKRCLSENWIKHDLRRTPASSLRLCVQRGDESDDSDGANGKPATDGTSSWEAADNDTPSNRLPLPTIIDKRTGSAVSMCVPKLTPLGSPEPTSPRSPSDMRGAVDSSMELVRRHESIIARKLSQQARRMAGGKSLLRIASMLGAGGSRRPSISHSMRSVHSVRPMRSMHSMHLMLVPDSDAGEEEEEEDEPPLPQPRRKHIQPHGDESEDDGEVLSIASKISTSTAFDSTSDLSTSDGALEFYAGDNGSSSSNNNNNKSGLAPYVDPYANHRVPDMQTKQAPEAEAAIMNSAVLDKSLIKMAGDSLKSMVSEILLDRERLEFVREGLASGGITAATIWYSFPWLHLELLQFDGSRQRLIAMLLSHAHTCPPDALHIFALNLSSTTTNYNADDYEQAFIGSLDARDREEYLRIQDAVASGQGAPLSPSQVWRFVIRPVVAHDSELFYSDYKMMTVGIARLSMTAPKNHRH